MVYTLRPAGRAGSVLENAKEKMEEVEGHGEGDPAHGNGMPRMRESPQCIACFEETNRRDMKDKPMPMQGKYVLVTTIHRGVFFGKLVEEKGSGHSDWWVVLSEAQNIPYWSAETKGFLGLAAYGPQKGSRVGPRVPSLKLQGVTSVAEMTDEAVTAWKGMQWN